MADTNSVGVVLDFLRRNQLTRAEAALCSELNNQHDLNGFLESLTLEEKALHDALEKDKGKPLLDNRTLDIHDNVEVSRELIVKEIECGAGRNVTGSKCESDKNFTFPKSLEDSVLDLYSWKLNPSNGSLGRCQNDSQQSKHQTSEVIDMVNGYTKSGEENTMPAHNKASGPGSSSRNSIKQSYNGIHAKEPKELDRQPKSKNSSLKENFADNPWLRTNENENSSSDLWKDCSVKTVFPFSKGDISTTYNCATYSGNKEENKTEIIDIRAAMKAQVDEVGRAIYAGKSQGSSEEKIIGSLNFPVAPQTKKEELPRLPPLKLKSEDRSLTVNWEEKFERHEPASKLAVADSNLLIGSYLDVPVGPEINPADMRRAAGGSWLSVSQGITEDTSDLVSGFATIGDGLSESADYPNENWDSDEYDDDDDDDVGYMRQPIEDETWFLAHEVDYPSDNEKATGHGSVPDPQDRGPAKDEDDDQSFAEEDPLSLTSD